MKAGWERKKIGDVCKVISGQSPSGRYYNQEATGIPFYQGKKEFTERILGQPTNWTTSITKEAIAGDIVMSVRAPVGPVNEVNERICIGRGLAAIRSGDEIKKDFLWYFLLSIQSEIEGKDGAVFASINRQQIESIELVLPPLEEQQRIIEKLDEVFAGLDEARSNVAANIEDCKELFQSVLHENLKDGEKKGWKERQLGDVAKIVNGGTPKSNVSEFWHGSVQWLTPKDMGKMDGDSIGETPRTITEGGLMQSSARLIPPNSVIMSTRAPIGHLAINTVAMAFNQGCRGLVPSSSLDARYLFYFLKLKRNDLEKMGKGTTFRELPRVALQTFKMPLPSIEEQQRIVEKLDAMRSQIDQLRQEYTAQLADIDELRQSVLQKAFAGELT